MAARSVAGPTASGGFLAPSSSSPGAKKTERGFLRECAARRWDASPRPPLRAPLRSRGAVRPTAAKATKKGKSAQSAKGGVQESGPAPRWGLTVTETEEPDSRVRLSVTVPETACKKVWEKTIRELSKQVKVDGFRQGSPLPDYVLMRHIGEKSVKGEVLRELLHATMSEALETVVDRALKDSEHIVQKADDLIDSFSPTSSLQYDVTVDVIPAVKWTSERAYASLSVEVEVPEEASLAAEVEAQIRARHKDLGSLKVSVSGGIKMGDVVVLDISAFRVAEDGSSGDQIFSATQKGFQLDTEEGALGLLPGFLENIMSMERGDTRDFVLTFPDTWQQESLRGVQGRFEVKCAEIFERDLPPLEDALSEKFLPQTKTMAEVRERLTGALAQGRQQKKKQATMLALVEAVGEVCAMDVPNSLLEDQGRQMYGAKLIELQAGGRISKEDVAQLMTEQMVNNYLVTQKDKLQSQVRQALAMQEIFRAENLSFSDEELQAECNSAIAEFKAYGQEYDEQRVREQAAELLEGAKVLEWLVENAEVKYITR